MKTVYYLLLGLCLATAACKPDEPEMPEPEEPEMPTDEIINGTCGDNLTWSYNKTKAILTIAGTGEMEDYSPYSDTPWKPYRKEIQTVIIGDSVTSIGDYAFYDCEALTQVNISNSVKSIGSYAFYKTALYNNAANWTNNVLYIDNCLIEAKEELSGSYEIAAGTRVIADYAFDSCRALTQVNIPDSVTSIGDKAFLYCNALTQVTIPNSVTSIGETAFANCDALTQVTIPNSVTNIGDKAFAYCHALTAIHVAATNTAYCSENGILFNKNKTTLIQYPARKTETAYAIPSSVTNIGDMAFEGCDALKEITIPNSVISIGEETFTYCYALTAIHVDAANTTYCSENGVLFNKDKTTLVRYPARKKENTYTIPDGVTNIGSWAFYDCSALTQVTIPNSVTSIGNNAFSYCTALTQMTIPDGVTSIGDKAFSRCSALKQVTIPDGVTSIGDMAFVNCSKLTQVSIGNSVKSIGNGAFLYCDALTQVTIGSSVASIGESAFSWCSALAEMIVLATVPPTVGYNAFYEISRSIPVYVPAESLEAYKTAEGWNKFTNLQAIP